MTEIMDGKMVREILTAVLVGGPENIPDAARTCAVAPHDTKVKLPHYGGYEHFERTDATYAPDPVFHWSMRTAIAE